MNHSSAPSTQTLTNTVKKEYNCPHCIKVFPKAYNLKSHIMTHTGEKPHQCPHCSKEFRHLSTLKNHIRLHTGEKPHKCPHCSKAFCLSSKLKNHIMIHTGEKPHECPHCHRAFSRSDSLNQHLLTHTGERPYICSYCNKAFTRLYYLKQHKSTQCDRNFSIPKKIIRYVFHQYGEKSHSPYYNTGFNEEMSPTQHTLNNMTEGDNTSNYLNTGFIRIPFSSENNIPTEGNFQNCPDCIRGFITVEELMDHIIIHP